jgi:hypothetical protein
MSLSEDHPNLSLEINAAIRQSEADGGILWSNVEPGVRALVRTKSRTYIVEKNEDGETLISGHPRYCPTPVKANIHGSTWGGSMIKIGWIGLGMRLEFSTAVHPGAITTTTIQDLLLEPIR